MSNERKITKEGLRTLSLDELYTLATLNNAVQSNMTEKLFAFKAMMPLGRPSFDDGIMIQEIMIEKKFQKTSPASGIQEYALASGYDTVYTAKDMTIADVAGAQVVPVSRLPIPVHYHAVGKKTVREGSDLVAGFLSAITKWDGGIIPSTNLTSLGKRGYQSMSNPEAMLSLIPLMYDIGIADGLETKVGKKGREWAFHIMERLQRAESTMYAKLHTYLTIHVFGVAVRNPMGEILHDVSYEKSLKINQAVTTLGKTSCFWVKDLPKDCRVCYDAKAPTVEDTYNALCEGIAFRGGPGSAIGSLMTSMDTWGLPTHTRADLEIELAVLHGIKNNITCIGVPEYKKVHYIASFQHYKSKYSISFLREKTLLESKPIDGMTFVDAIDPSTTVFYHIDSPMSTGIKKKKDSAVEIYDPKQVSLISSENYDTMIGRIVPKGKYVFLCPYIPQDNCTHNITTIRIPYDAKAVISNDSTICIADSLDAVTITFRDYEWLSPAAYRQRVVRSVNGSLGIFFGAKNFACYGRANLVRPPKGKLKRLIAFEHYDTDGMVQVDYWDKDEPSTQIGAPTTTTTAPGPQQTHVPAATSSLVRATIVNEDM